MELKSEQNRKFEARRSSGDYFGTGPAECAEPAEALESVSSRVLIWHASSPERGRRTQSLTRTPPGLKKRLLEMLLGSICSIREEFLFSEKAGM